MSKRHVNGICVAAVALAVVAGPAGAAELSGEPHTQAIQKVRRTIHRIGEVAGRLPHQPVPHHLIYRFDLAGLNQCKQLYQFTEQASPWRDPLAIIGGIGEALERSKVVRKAPRIRVVTAGHPVIETYAQDSKVLGIYEAWLTGTAVPLELSASAWGIDGQDRSYRFDVTAGSRDTVSFRRGKQLIPDAFGKDPATLGQWITLTAHGEFLGEKEGRVALPPTESLIGTAAEGALAQRLQALRHYIQGPNTELARTAIEGFLREVSGALIIRRPTEAEVAKYARLDPAQDNGVADVAVVATAFGGRKLWSSAHTFDGGLASGEPAVYLGFHLTGPQGRETSLTHYIGGPPRAVLKSSQSITAVGRTVKVSRNLEFGPASPLDGLNLFVDTLKVSEPFAAGAKAAQ